MFIYFDLLMISICVWIIILFPLCIDSIPSLKAKCYVETSSRKIIAGNICSVKYDMKGCIQRDEYKFLGAYDDEEMVPEIHQEQYKTSSSIINISLSLPVSGSAVLFVNGATKTNQLRCVSVKFGNIIIPINQQVYLHLDNLELPEGFYNLTGTIDRDRRSIQNLSHVIFTHISFDIPKDSLEDFWNAPCNKDEVLERTKLERRIRELRKRECSCNNCISTSHVYYKDSGLLRFYYNLSDNACTNFTLNLLKYVNPSTNVTEKSCLELNEQKGIAPLDNMAAVGPTRLSEKAPIDFPNTKTGCYMIRTFQGEFHGYFWVEAENVTHMDSWNTSILLTPRYDGFPGCLSLEVKWTLPEFPFNFTCWSLTLWHLNSSFNCEGRNLQLEKLLSFETSEKRFYTNEYTFTNLTEGYYCVRLVPHDNRCDSDGCAPRSSKTLQLIIPKEKKGNLDNNNKLSLWLIALIIVAGMVGGVFLSLLCYRYRKRSYKPPVSYRAVPVELLETVSVLVIWTRFGLKDNNNAQFESILKAFKDLLREYSLCKVYDYLDISELERKQRQSLMTNPIEWLHIHLKDPQKKIILVGSEGAKIKQNLQSVSLQEEQAKVVGVYGDSLDALLFPYVLRYLQESKDLASDYSRIFHIRFPDVHGTEADLDGIVPWMRFSIPQHLRSLTLKLRGVSEEQAVEFPSPSEEQLNTLQSLLSDSNHKSCNTSSIDKIVNGDGYPKLNTSTDYLTESVNSS